MLTPIPRSLAPIKGEGELSSRFADFEAPPSFWDTSPVRRGTEGALGLGWGENAQIHITRHSLRFGGFARFRRWL